VRAVCADMSRHEARYEVAEAMLKYFAGSRREMAPQLRYGNLRSLQARDSRGRFVRVS
jgi:hypothetical protein